MGDQGRESKRADAPKREVRFVPINGHRQLGGARPISADIVAKVFFGGGTQILRPIDAAIE
jgi:hypothetical protein